LNETSEAITELLNEESIVDDWGNFLTLCVESTNQEQRWEGVRKYLFDRISEKNLKDIICKWVYKPDPCFSVCALFNLSELKEDHRVEFRVMCAATQKHRSLLLKISDISLLSADITDELLCDKFLSFLIRRYNESGKINIHNLILQVISSAGFLAFNLTIFRHFTSWSAIDPTKTIYCKELAGTLEAKYMNNKLTTDKKYWMYYVLVEKLKGKHGLKESFELVAQRCGVVNKNGQYGPSIKARYYEQKKKLMKIQNKNQDYGLRNIIADNSLAGVYERYL